MGGAGSPEASLLGIGMAICSVSSHNHPVCVRVLISSSYKDISHLGLGPTPMSAFHFYHLFKGLSKKKKKSYSEVLWLGLHLNKFWEGKTGFSNTTRS